MGTKTNPGRFNCHAAALPDEPIFTVLARDLAMPALVRFWVDERIRLGLLQDADDMNKLNEARLVADAAALWRNQHLDPVGDGIPAWKHPRPPADAGDDRPVRFDTVAATASVAEETAMIQLVRKIVIGLRQVSDDLTGLREITIPEQTDTFADRINGYARELEMNSPHSIMEEPILIPFMQEVGLSATERLILDKLDEVERRVSTIMGQPPTDASPRLLSKPDDDLEWIAELCGRDCPDDHVDNLLRAIQRGRLTPEGEVLLTEDMRRDRQRFLPTLDPVTRVLVVYQALSSRGTDCERYGRSVLAASNLYLSGAGLTGKGVLDVLTLGQAAARLEAAYWDDRQDCAGWLDLGRGQQP